MAQLGSAKWVCPMKKRFLSLPSLPNSAGDSLEITSPEDGSYNCVAWAIGDSEHFYWPKKLPGLDWPKGLPRKGTTANLITFFKSHGFETCENGLPEKGREKIAIFEKNGLPTHACRLLKNGPWTSKLGILEDVRHSLSSISGGMYGEVSVFMQR